MAKMNINSRTLFGEGRNGGGEKVERIFSPWYFTSTNCGRRFSPGEVWSSSVGGSGLALCKVTPCSRVAVAKVGSYG